MRVRGRSRRRLSVAALVCCKPGRRFRLIYRPSRDARPDGRKSFAWTDYRDLIQAAHQQLGGPIVLIWDNLNTHLTTGLRGYIDQRDWLTVYQLPAYAPDLNPVERLWSVLHCTSLANCAFTDPDDLVTTRPHWPTPTPIPSRRPRRLLGRHRTQPRTTMTTSRISLG